MQPENQFSGVRVGRGVRVAGLEVFCGEGVGVKSASRRSRASAAQPSSRDEGGRASSAYQS